METKYRFTQHAIRRIEEMLVTSDEVKACLLQPVEVWQSKANPGSMNRRRGRLTLCTALMDADDGTPELVIITALWSNVDDWEDDLKAHGPYKGRTQVKHRAQAKRR